MIGTMKHGSKMTILKQSITDKALSLKQINRAHPVLGILYLRGTVKQCKSIVVEGSDVSTGAKIYKYKPELDLPEGHMKLSPEPVTALNAFGNCHHMLLDKIMCLKRRIASNYVSERDKDILFSVLNDYTSLIHKKFN